MTRAGCMGGDGNQCLDLRSIIQVERDGTGRSEVEVLHISPLPNITPILSPTVLTGVVYNYPFTMLWIVKRATLSQLIITSLLK